MPDGEIFVETTEKLRGDKAIGSPAVSGAAEELLATPMPPVLVLGGAAGQAGASHLPLPCCCRLLQHPHCGPVSRAEVSAHPVHPSQTQLGRWHLLLWGVH